MTASRSRPTTSCSPGNTPPIPATAAVTLGSYKDLKVEKVDDFTVTSGFQQPTPFWADAFVGARGMILPKHLFADYAGAKSRDAPANLKPVGTGPYRFVDFKPGDLVRGEINPDYHIANRPHFDTIEMKGGGDAVSAARAVLQTGEYDFAWNLQVEDEILQRMETGRQRPRRHHRRAATSSTSSSTTPIPGPRSTASARASRRRHPVLTDPAVRAALGLLVDRKSCRSTSTAGPALRPAISSTIRSASARRTRRGSSTSRRPTRSSKTAGWKQGADGIRAKDGKKLKFVYQTSINTPRQKTQAIVKQACQKAGIDIELKSVTASVYFSSDVANPDTYREVLLRHADVHDQHDAAGPGDIHEAVRLRGGRAEGEQVAGP